MEGPKFRPELTLVGGGRFIIMGRVADIGRIAQSTENMPLTMDGREVARVKVVDRMPGTRPSTMGVVFEIQSVTAGPPVSDDPPGPSFSMGSRLDGKPGDEVPELSEGFRVRSFDDVPFPLDAMVAEVIGEFRGRAGFAGAWDATDESTREEIRAALASRIAHVLHLTPLESPPG